MNALLVQYNQDGAYNEAANFLKLLANPNRLAVLCALHSESFNVTELTNLVGLPQAAMSTQLAVLREAKLVDCEVNHRERRYYISDERVNDMIELLYTFFCEETKAAIQANKQVTTNGHSLNGMQVD
ncbi:MAG: metalloregulator ArsR/SmtB family transcription factor [Pelistega sp.]|nr:metalloregulator ArsR/SmtB family transcription factor [Pelistega sp.]